MLTIEELKRNALETELRKQRLEESIPHTQALVEAKEAAETAENDAETAENDAKAKEQAFQDAAPGEVKDALKIEAEKLRNTASTKKNEAKTAKQAAEDARIKAEVYQKHALEAGTSHTDAETTAVATRLVGAIFNLSTWIWVALFVAVGVLLYTVKAQDSAFLVTVGEPKSARALIMVLILGTTLLLAVMLCYQAYATGTTNEQFRMAREIYTTLIGVVGTVVGFYFATPATDLANSPQNPQGQEAKQLPRPKVTVAGDKLKVEGLEGKAPFQWSFYDSFDMKKALIIGEAKEGNSFEIPAPKEWKGKTVVVKSVNSEQKEQVSEKIPIP